MASTRRFLLRHRTILASIVIAIVGGALAALIVGRELQAGRPNVDWPVFGVIAALLILCERTPSTWIRVGPAGVVTPMWMFAFALMLVGSPALATLVALSGSIVHSLTQRERADVAMARVGGTAISLSVAGIVLMGLGVHGTITQLDGVSWQRASGIVAAGLLIISMNTLVAAWSMAVQRRTSFLALVQRGVAVRLTSEGALLSLAPLWVIGIDFGLVMIPLLGITTALVFRSTRQALERSHEAHHDPLTGLLNRRSFLDHLEIALTESRAAIIPVVLVMDLDGFKDINDRLGHQLGDSLLISFADQLEQHLPTDAAAARLGGDEFAVLLTDIDDPDNVAAVVRKLHAALLRPLQVEGFPVSIGVSMGAAASPQDGRTSRDLLRAADVAMYKAKRTGSRLEHYEDCVNGPQRGRLNLLGDLADAIAHHQLYIHFQPQLRMADGEVDTLEALVRWQHPEHGTISPGEFIGLAEQTDLIAPITDMVLRAATRGLVISGVDAKLAVNVSPRSLQDPDFASHVFEILRETRFEPSNLELEVTERSIVSNAERCRYTIGLLRAAGIRIAIDDFGVGYSSFHALRMLEVDRVKIDRDFVTGILSDRRDRLIVASVIDLAHDLGLDVVAEGVENTQLWDALADLGCDVAQGYGVAMPMAYPELRGWLSSWGEVLTDEQAHRSDTPLPQLRREDPLLVRHA